MKILYVISGVAGMTGNELARQITGTGHSVIGFDNYFASSQETIQDLLELSSFTFFKSDLTDDVDMKTLENYVQERKPNYEAVYYINCAGVVHTEYFYQVGDTFSTNVLGMKSFLDQAVRVGAEVYINCSTSEVYSMHSAEEGGVKEDCYISLATAEHSQRTSYAVGKLMTEFFIKDAVDKGLIRGCSIRFANVYSKNEKYPKHIIPHIITSLLEDGAVKLLNNAKTTKRTFLFNEDSCSAVLALMNQKAALDGSAYNVATQEEIGILQLVQLIGSKVGVENPKIIFEGFRTADPPQRILSTEKIKQSTGWCAKTTLENGLEQCISVYRRKLGK